MSYAHMFYAIDLQRLQAVAGSKDLQLFEEIKRTNDSLQDEELDALRRIIMGECQSEPGDEHLYGYALKAICEHLGEMVGEDVGAVRDHPYKSTLIANGPPIKIPYTESDFPEIGYLQHSELAAEYRLATETKPQGKWTLLGFLLRRISGGMVGREPDAEAVGEDMQAYAATLQECLDKNQSLVSFRH